MMKSERNVLIACTGSVATIKLLELIKGLSSSQIPLNINIKIITTQPAQHFIDKTQLPEDISLMEDSDEWSSWQKRGDPVLHIELGKWADLLLIAPLSANSLAKISTGICDNLLMSVVRSWDLKKPLYFCPAMNTRMYDHPLTLQQINILKSWGYLEIPVITKTLMCGDTGAGAMAEISTIINTVLSTLQKQTN